VGHRTGLGVMSTRNILTHAGIEHRSTHRLSVFQKKAEENRPIWT